MEPTKQTINRHQLRTLIQVGIKQNWRGATNPFEPTADKKATVGFPGLAIWVGLNLFLSFALGGMILAISDFFISLVLSSFLAMTIVSMQVLMEFGNIIIIPDDFHIIGPRPVNSKTFFISKLIQLIYFVSLLSLAISIIPSFFALAKTESILSPVALILQFWICNLFASFLMMTIYTLIMKKTDRSRLERILGYVQLVMMILIMSGSFIFAQLFREYFMGADLSAALWVKLLPTYWFASPYKLISSGWDFLTFTFACGALILLIIISRVAFSYLSLSYADSLSRIPSNLESKQRNYLPRFVVSLWNRYARPEDKALLMITRANFKHDAKFRLGIMSFLPILLIYGAIGIREAGDGIFNPLNPIEGTAEIPNLLFGFAVSFFPLVIMSAMHSSKSWESAWVYFSTPMDRVRMVQSVGRIIILIITFPFGVGLFLIYLYFFKNPLDAFLHTLFLVTVGTNIITFGNLFSFTSKLPFSTDFSSGNVMMSGLGGLLLSLVVFMPPIIYICIAGYHGYIGWVVAMVIMLVIKKLLAIGSTKRIEIRVKKLEFFG